MDALKVSLGIFLNPAGTFLWVRCIYAVVLHGLVELTSVLLTAPTVWAHTFWYRGFSVGALFLEQIDQGIY